MLAVCSGTGDCKRCKGETLLCGSGFWKWNGDCCFLLLSWKELWTSWWASHHHWKWTISMPRNSLPAILHRWDMAFLSRDLTVCEKKYFLESIGNLQLLELRYFFSNARKKNAASICLMNSLEAASKRYLSVWI